MPVPKHIFDPPFNVVRCSHAVLRVRDLDASRAFYERIIGLQVEDAGKARSISAAWRSATITRWS